MPGSPARSLQRERVRVLVVTLHGLDVCSSPKNLALPLRRWAVTSASKIKENPS